MFYSDWLARGGSKYMPSAGQQPDDGMGSQRDLSRHGREVRVMLVHSTDDDRQGLPGEADVCVLNE